MDAQGSGKRHRRRFGIGACIAVAMLTSLALIVASGFGSEQAATQNLSITLSKGTTTVSSSGPLVSGLTRIVARNTTKAPVDFALVRIKPGKTFADLQAELNRSGGVPESTTATLTSYFGLPPGRAFITTMNLPPGDYATTQPPSGKGTGPVTQFSIANGSAGGTPPPTTGTVQLYDYGISAPASIRGRGVLKVNNIGNNYHFLIGLRLNPGVNADKVVSDIKTGAGGNGPPPGQFVTIIGVVNPGSINYVNTSLRPGSYVIACFNSDRHSAGHEHSQFGMVRKLTVQ